MSDKFTALVYSVLISSTRSAAALCGRGALPPTRVVTFSCSVIKTSTRINWNTWEKCWRIRVLSSMVIQVNFSCPWLWHVPSPLHAPGDWNSKETWQIESKVVAKLEDKQLILASFLTNYQLRYCTLWSLLILVANRYITFDRKKLLY